MSEIRIVNEFEEKHNLKNLKDFTVKLLRVDVWSMDGTYEYDAENKRCNQSCSCHSSSGESCKYLIGYFAHECSDNFYYSSGIACKNPDCIKYAKKNKESLFKKEVD